MRYKIIFLFFLSFSSLGSQCLTRETVTRIEEVELEGPPEIETMIRSPIEKVFNEDGSYCTVGIETGHRFYLFRRNEDATPVLNWEEESQGFNICLSAGGLLDLVNYFRNIICSEAIIDCGLFETSGVSIEGLSPEALELSLALNYIEDNLVTLKSDNEIERIKKSLLRQVFSPIRNLSLAALESEGINFTPAYSDEI